MEITKISEWLFQQLPVVVVMGIVIYYMYKANLKKDDLIQEKDKAIIAIAEKSITTATMYEATKHIGREERQNIIETGREERKRIIELLEEVKDAIGKIKNGK